jgi:hypothetical protein
MEHSPKVEMNFSFDAFRTLLESVKAAGYIFRRFDAAGPLPDQAFFLRHDVDISPRCALTLGQIEHEEGVVANFFFQLNADTYNIFDGRTLDIMRRLRTLGHCIGLHIDENLLSDDEEVIAQTIEWFDRCITPIDRVISFHRPTPVVLGRGFASFVNTYSASFFSADRYLSDSRRDLGFWPLLEGWLRARRHPIQLLLHPVWWYPHATPELLWQDLKARREAELKRYMLTTCRQVFAGVIEADEDDGHV